jgi:hypothetical protein
MSTVSETNPRTPPRDWSARRLDDRCFLVVLAALLMMSLATAVSTADLTGASNAPAIAGSSGHAKPAISTCPA